MNKSNEEDSKLLGVYSSQEIAEEKIETHYRNQDGFKEHRDGFHIDEYELDQMQWIEGYSTIE